jgi:hypothetical protein
MRRTLLTLIGCALLAGCGGSSHTTNASSTPSSTTTAPDSAVQLEQAVHRAVESNASLSNWVLWHNEVPSWATQSTGGPALAALRSSAAGRRTQHLQVRGISPRFAVLSITLDPSYQSATAVIKETGEVRPYRDGKSLGHPIKVNETARLEFRRAGSEARFVVWKVGPAR